MYKYFFMKFLYFKFDRKVISVIVAFCKRTKILKLHIIIIVNLYIII